MKPTVLKVREITYCQNQYLGIIQFCYGLHRMSESQRQRVLTKHSKIYFKLINYYIKALKSFLIMLLLLNPE